MTNKVTVWAVEQGCYSDYRVVGVFSTEEKAKQMAWALRESQDPPEIVEWPLDPWGNELNQGLICYRARMWRDGTSEVYSRDIEDEFCYLAPWGDDGSKYLAMTMWAKDEEHAIKIANEKRAQLIAGGEWK